MDNEIIYIKLDDIIPNRFQPREVFDEEALNKLADSIKQHGVIEPILVRPIMNKYEIVAGERRYKASVLAGLTKIPAIVRQLDDKESSIVAFIENEHRSNVSAIEEAKTMERILKNNNMTQEELAKELGVNQSTIANKIRLLNLPNEVQEALMRNEISERHARSLLTVKNEEKQLELLKKIKEKRMTVRELDSEIKEMNNMNGNINNEYMNNYGMGNVGAVPPIEPVAPSMPGAPVAPGVPEMGGQAPDPGFMDFLNNYDKEYGANQGAPVPPVAPGVPETGGQAPDPGFMDFLNNYDKEYAANQEQPEELTMTGMPEVNPTPVPPVAPGVPETGGQAPDPGFMNFLNNYDRSYQNNEPTIPSVPEFNNPEPPMDFSTPDTNIGGGFDESIYSNYDSTNDDNNVVLNDITPQITSNFDKNQYIEDTPDFVDVSKQNIIDNVDDIIMRLKNVVDDIKNNSKFKIDTDEINYDDIYQITIKIDKRDF